MGSSPSEWARGAFSEDQVAVTLTRDKHETPRRVASYALGCSSSDMPDAISLSIFRRGSRLAVCAAVLTLSGFQSVKMFPVAGKKDGLLRALESAERFAVALTRSKTRDKRITSKTPDPDWSLMGAPTYEALTEDATMVGVVRDDESPTSSTGGPRGRKASCAPPCEKSSAPGPR